MNVIKGRGSCASKCLTKRTFDTEEEAVKEMKWLKIDPKYKKLKRAYTCDLCGKWHLTKNTL
jgi:hypothetical protein